MANPTIQTISSDVDELLKIKYGPKLVELQNNEPMLYKMFSKSSRELRGDHFEFPARTQQPQGIGPRPLRTTLPTIVAATQATVKIYLKTLYAAFDIAGPDMERAKGNMNAFVDGLDDQMKSLMLSFLKDINFQCYLSGTGQYATIVSTAAATTAVVDTVKYLRRGRRFDVWDDSATQLVSCASFSPDLSITDIDPSTNTITTSVAHGATTSDSFIPETGLASTSTAPGIFINGLRAIVDDGTDVITFQNVSRTSERLWRAHIFDKAGADLNATDLQLLFDIPMMATGKQIDLILGSQNGRKQYLDTLVTQKRFMTQKLDGGYTTLEYNGKSFMEDVDCQDATIYGLCRDSIASYGAFEPAFDESDGKILKWTSRQDVFEGFLKAYVNLGAEQCNCNAKFIGVPVDSRYRVAT